jgi:hypothetical protein
MYVDLSDHWSHGDPSIGEVNFLRYPPRQWRRLNPSNHFQNRLRHSDYLRLFAAAGFAVESDVITRWDGPLVIDPALGPYDPDDARITRVWYVLRRA